MKLFFSILFLALLPCAGFAQAGRIYTQPEPANTGALHGKAPGELTHAMAVERDRVRVYSAALEDSGTGFRFEQLPPGKYDLVLVSKDGAVYEGLELGKPAELSSESQANMEKRIAVADGFFNRHTIHRTGVSEDGEILLAFVERYRADNVLKGSGEALGKLVRRLEIIELTRATEDWQMSASRHLYREGEPMDKTQFLKSQHLPGLGGIRVIDAPKELGSIQLSTQP